MADKQKRVEIAQKAKDGDSKALTDLWMSLRPYAMKCISKWDRSLQPGMESEAYICLVESVPKWDPQRGPIAQYYGYKLKTRLSEMVRKEGLVVVPLHKTRAGVRCEVHELVVEGMENIHPLAAHRSGAKALLLATIANEGSYIDIF